MAVTRKVIGGVDTHSATNHAAALDTDGRMLGDAEFGATPAGYAALLAWLQRHGTVTAVGVEGCGAYGAGLARFLHDQQVTVLEAITDPATGEVRPTTIVTDNGGPFRSARFAATIDSRPELGHVRTRVRTPGQNGVRERGFESLKYERLYREHITDGLVLADHAEAYRLEYNTLRPHEAISWNRPADVHRGLADPAIPNFEQPGFLPSA